MSSFRAKTRKMGRDLRYKAQL
uniref:Uncharacterized protein n=1 Tax=Rhizophora mucronata TaxID=61149 RepID=A0A2P2ISM2_RHIMU